MTAGQQRYGAKKEQLLTRIDCLIGELTQLRQTGPAENIPCLITLLEACLKELSVLRQTSNCHRRRHE